MPSGVSEKLHLWELVPLPSGTMYHKMVWENGDASYLPRYPKKRNSDMLSYACRRINGMCSQEQQLGSRENSVEQREKTK